MRANPIRSWGVVPLTTSLATLAAFSAQAAQGDPMKVSLALCQPDGLGRVDPMPGDPIYLLPGNIGPGFSNSAATRTLRVHLVYHHDATDVDAAISKVNKIQLCTVDAAGAVNCPCDWVIFQRTGFGSAGCSNGAIGSLTSSSVSKCIVSGQPITGQSPLLGLMAVCPQQVLDTVEGTPTKILSGTSTFDWGNPSSPSVDQAVFVRVTTTTFTPPTNSTTAAEINQQGACMVPSIRAVTPAGPGQPVPSQIVSIRPGFSPFANQLNFCRSLRVRSSFSQPDFGCLTDAQSEYVRKLMPLMVTGQDRLQAKLLNAPPLGTAPEPTQIHRAWANGTSNGTASGVPLPVHTMLGQFGSHAPGNMTISVNNGVYVALDSAVDTPFPAAGTPSMMSCTNCLSSLGNGGAKISVMWTALHEYFHQLQWQWWKEHPNMQPVFPGDDFERHARAIEAGSCLFNYPNEPDPLRCVSTAKIQRTQNTSIGAGSTFLDRAAPQGRFYGQGQELMSFPENDLLSRNYNGFFWSYVFQQFAYPVSDAAAPQAVRPPGGTPSLIQREADADVRLFSARPNSDQGFDFIGLLYRHLAQVAPGKGKFDAMDEALKTNLRRTFRDVLFDMHTAFYLKDYSGGPPDYTPDPRWRFDWAHQDGFSADSWNGALSSSPWCKSFRGSWRGVTEGGDRRERRGTERRPAPSPGGQQRL